jgi:hypothetical protein
LLNERTITKIKTFAIVAGILLLTANPALAYAPKAAQEQNSIVSKVNSLIVPEKPKDLAFPQGSPTAPPDPVVIQKVVYVSRVSISETTDPKLFIYNHESGNDPTRYNSEGCLGLGQACPASKLLAVCPTMDYACEDAWFTNYAVSRYGSWQGAYNFWVAHRWW